MPNWCENRLAIAGSSEEVQKFLDRVGDEIKMLESHLPTPPELLENDGVFTDEQKLLFKEKYGARDWYDWRVNNWGTKWEIDSANITCDEDGLYGDIRCVCLDFLSAWAPPEEGIISISKMYSRLLFNLSYEEPGMGFEGNLRCIEGNIILQESREMLSKYDWFIDNLEEEYAMALDACDEEDGE